MNVLRAFSVVGYLLIVIALVPLVYLHAVFSSSPIVLTVQTLAVALMIWARIAFGARSFHFAADPTKGGLVTSGPYKLVRHPIYAAILYFTLAGVGGNRSLTTIALLFLVCLGVGIRIFCEERLVAVEYPEYAEYAKRTKRILPFIF
jgi:protein-S-isoprenylcysteine O-methyltransferase Ste14